MNNPIVAAMHAAIGGEFPNVDSTVTEYVVHERRWVKMEFDGLRYKSALTDEGVRIFVELVAALENAA